MEKQPHEVGVQVMRLLFAQLQSATPSKTIDNPHSFLLLS